MLSKILTELTSLLTKIEGWKNLTVSGAELTTLLPSHRTFNYSQDYICFLALVLHQYIKYLTGSRAIMKALTALPPSSCFDGENKLSVRSAESTVNRY